MSEAERFEFKFLVTAEFLNFYTLRSVETVQAGLMTELRLDITFGDPARVGAFIARLQQLNGNNRVLVTSAADAAVAD